MILHGNDCSTEKIVTTGNEKACNFGSISRFLFFMPATIYGGVLENPFGF
jgi:hypothetical protein